MFSIAFTSFELYHTIFDDVMMPVSLWHARLRHVCIMNHESFMVLTCWLAGVPFVQVLSAGEILHHLMRMGGTFKFSCY